ncbi:hypothetical protein BHM03_00050186 [Ensete ventricosum]|nr:hypothetical protein BHM03_00050186 [Ensete ventricosum]
MRLGPSQGATNPQAGPTTHDQVGCGEGPLQGGGRPRPKPLAGVAVSKRGRPWVWLVPAARPQVAAARCKVTRGSPAARATAGRSGRQQGQHPRKAAPPEGSSACLLRRAAATMATQMRARGIGHTFRKRTILPQWIQEISMTVLVYRIPEIPSTF